MANEPINLYNIYKFFDDAFNINIKQDEKGKSMASIDDSTPEEWNAVVSRSTDLGKMLMDKMKEADSYMVGGSHYKSTNIQPWDVFIDWELDPWLCNVLKYVQRHNKKNGKQDLEKALHYLQFAVNNYEKIRSIYYKKGE